MLRSMKTTLTMPKVFYLPLFKFHDSHYQRNLLEVPIEPPPKTYTIKDAYEFYKPKISVEMDNVDRAETVTEIHIKGWKVEKQIFDVLIVCLPYVERLHTLKYADFKEEFQKNYQLSIEDFKFMELWLGRRVDEFIDITVADLSKFEVIFLSKLLFPFFRADKNFFQELSYSTQIP
jgi:hypothetical protein